VSVNTSASPTAGDDGGPWSIRGLIARHKRVALGVAAVIVVMVAPVVIALLGSSTRAVVSDATTCSQWGSTNQAQQAAYARLYVREHGLPPNGPTSPASVIAAINNGCSQAYDDDVDETATVVQAISGNF
jgi:hypothetical protein